jgi:CheY-like chemotaxis protein
MPKMTGERLARELISIRPEIPIILCTGFSEQIDEQKAKAIGVKAFLMKPLTLGRLAETVRAVMN